MTYSRRQVLSGATYGVGATLLFGRSLADGTAVARAGIAGSERTDTSSGTPSDTSVSDAATGASGRRRDPSGGFDAMRLGDHGHPRSACKGREGVMVVGVAADGDPVSWMNDGDATWHEQTLRRPARGEPEVWGVSAHGGRFVAVGSMLQQDAISVAGDPGQPPDGGDAPDATLNLTFTSSRRLPTVWWTRDNTQWEGRMLDQVDERHAQLISVSCNSRLLVAVGSTLDADGVQGDGALAMTSSDDGQTWQRGEIAPGDVALAEGSFTGVAQIDRRWLATSTDINGGAVWSSPDGRRWSMLHRSARAFRGVTLQGIGALDGSVFVAGTALTDHTPRYFVSTDRGQTWRPLRPTPKALTGDDTTVNDLTVMSGEVVVVGTRRDVPVIEGGAPDAAN